MPLDVLEQTLSGLHIMNIMSIINCVAYALHRLCRGCIFETLPGNVSNLAATDQEAYVSRRSKWPCSQEACSLLTGPKVVHLVAALLKCAAGSSPFLYNDQVLLCCAVLRCVVLCCAVMSACLHSDSQCCVSCSIL